MAQMCILQGCSTAKSSVASRHTPTYSVLTPVKPKNFLASRQLLRKTMYPAVVESLQLIKFCIWANPSPLSLQPILISLRKPLNSLRLNTKFYRLCRTLWKRLNRQHLACTVMVQRMVRTAGKSQRRSEDSLVIKRTITATKLANLRQN